MYLMAAPAARGLFAKAIVQSGYMISTPELRAASFGAPSAEETGTRVASRARAPNIAALRAMTARAVMNAADASDYQPFGTVDGQILQRQLVDTFDRGEQAPVPVLAGFNSGEARSLPILLPPTPARASVYERLIQERYGDLAAEFLRLYPSATMQASILATTRDALYGWTAERLVRKQTALNAPSFLYAFDHGYPAADGANLRGFHASELPYVFGTIDRTLPYWPRIPATQSERQFSDAMVGYWTSFAHTGRPQAAGSPDWPAYGSVAALMFFADTPRPAANFLPGTFALHEAAMCRRRAAGQAWNWNVGVDSPTLSAAAQCS
jgi:para-nitrobenzyl esterase